MTKKPVFVEVYAWNEVILSLVALGWSAFLTFVDFEPLIINRRDATAGMVAVGAVALLSMQSAWLRTQIDYRLPTLAVRLASYTWKWRLIKVWPLSSIVRVVTHFCFTLWWILMGLVVSANVDSIEDVRLVFYFGFALLHLDRLLRLIVALRQ